MAFHVGSVPRPVGLLLIDLQRAFVDGIWRAYLPDEEVEPIKKSFQNCATLLRTGLNNVPTLMTRCPFGGSDFELHDSVASVVDKIRDTLSNPAHLSCRPMDSENGLSSNCSKRESIL